MSDSVELFDLYLTRPAVSQASDGDMIQTIADLDRIETYAFECLALEICGYMLNKMS